MLHTAVAVINMLELMPPLGGEDEVASDEDTLVDTVVSTTISRSTSLAAAEADRDLHLHLVYGSCPRDDSGLLQGGPLPEDYTSHLFGNTFSLGPFWHPSS